ncbi:MAG: PrgI family protein [bacterium]|nr:PrgI family protein [bacterium]
MQFKVPQFLDIEDKIFGPFTFRQFVYLVGGAGMSFVLFRVLGLLWGFIPIAILIALSLALAFYRPNNKPFIDMLEAGLKYFLQSKLYLWKKNTSRDSVASSTKIMPYDKNMNPPEIKMSSGKLRDLAWSLDVLDLNKEKNTWQ